MSEQSSEALGAAVRFIARRNDQIQRALRVLQKAQRYNCGTKAFRDEIMVPYPDGSWLRCDDVKAAIDILQEGGDSEQRTCKND